MTGNPSYEAGLNHTQNQQIPIDDVCGRNGNGASTSQVFPLPSDATQLRQRYVLHQDHPAGGSFEGMDEGVALVESVRFQGDTLQDMPMGMMPVPLGGNQLTLAFQSDVYVFDSVSQEKVQAVLLLLGGRQLTSVVTPVPSFPQPNNVYPNTPQRVASLMRFREKRKERSFNKKIHPNVRREVERRMERFKEQLATSRSKPDNGTSVVPSWDTTQSWGEAEGCTQASSVCRHCGIVAISAPMMRRGPDGPRTLCNACGLTWSNKPNEGSQENDGPDSCSHRDLADVGSKTKL